MGSDGKPQPIQGEVFSGLRIVQKADGTCLQVNTVLTDLKTISAGNVAVQIPTVAGSSSSVSCDISVAPTKQN